MTYRKSGVFISSVALIVFLTIATCSFGAEQKAVSARIGYLPSLSGTNLLVAETKGFFEQAGITITPVLFQTSNQIIEAILRGDIDLGTRVSFPSALLAEQAMPGKMTAFEFVVWSREAPIDSLIVLKESPLRSIADLQDKKIGIFPGTTATAWLKSALEKKHINTKRIEFLQMPQANHLPALYSKSIDALYTYDPTATIALQSGKTRRLHATSLLNELLDIYVGGVSVMSSDFVRKNPELAKKVVAVFDRVNEFVPANETATREILKKRLNIDSAVAEHVVVKAAISSHRINKKLLQESVDNLLEIGEIRQKIDPVRMLYSGRQ